MGVLHPAVDLLYTYKSTTAQKYKYWRRRHAAAGVLLSVRYCDRILELSLLALLVQKYKSTNILGLSILGFTSKAVQKYKY